MHLKRLLVAAVVVPLLYLYIMYLPPYYYLGLLTLITAAGLAEFYALAGVNGILRYSGIMTGAAILPAHFFLRGSIPDVIMLAALIVLAVRLFQKRDSSGSLRESTAAVFGLLYIPGLLSFQLDIVKAGAPLLVMLYSAVWGSDSMALYVGKSIGRRKLYKEISPNKTIEGAFGSLIGGVIGTMLMRAAIIPDMLIVNAVILGLVVGFTSIIGDLVESMFKRDVGIKDSSSFIPGHGGVLDKIDSATYAGPAFYWCCLMLGIIRL